MGLCLISKNHLEYFNFVLISENLLEGFVFAYLILLQIGYQDYRVQSISMRLVVFSACLFSYIIFSYYTADLTSLMTSGPPRVSLKSFEEALEADYKFMVWPDTSYESLLKFAPEDLFQFVAFQSRYGQELLTQHGFPTDPRARVEHMGLIRSHHNASCL